MEMESQKFTKKKKKKKQLRLYLLAEIILLSCIYYQIA